MQDAPGGEFEISEPQFSDDLCLEVLFYLLVIGVVVPVADFVLLGLRLGCPAGTFPGDAVSRASAPGDARPGWSAASATGRRRR